MAIVKIDHHVITESSILIHGQPYPFRDMQKIDSSKILPDGSLTKEEKDRVEAVEQERVANVQASIDHPVIQPPPTKEQVEAEALALDEQLTAISIRKAELIFQISEISIEEIIL